MASRYLNWTRAFEGFANYIKQRGIKVNQGNFSVENKIFNTYCSVNNIKGSFSERVLEVSKDFNSFKDYINLAATLKQPK